MFEDLPNLASMHSSPSRIDLTRVVLIVYISRYHSTHKSKANMAASLFALKYECARGSESSKIELDEGHEISATRSLSPSQPHRSM